MPDSKEIVTINANGIFVGGEPSLKYLGQTIQTNSWNKIDKNFEFVQKLEPIIQEVYVLSSVTPGKYGDIINPSIEHGKYMYGCIKLNGNHVSAGFIDQIYDNAITDWCCIGSVSESPEQSAKYCAHLFMLALTSYRFCEKLIKTAQRRVVELEL